MRTKPLVTLCAVGWALALLGCNDDSSTKADKDDSLRAADSGEVAWFHCYPDKFDADGTLQKDGECAVSQAACEELSLSHHKEALCYRQETSFCYVEERQLGDRARTATCTGSLYGCRDLRGKRQAGECRARKLDAELHELLR